MTVAEFKRIFLRALSDVYPPTEVDTFFFLLAEEVLGMQRVDTVLQGDLEISEENVVFLKSAIQRLRKEEPIQYLLGKTEFCGLPFLVTKNTLIPRPETEELVAWILEHTKEEKRALRILDIGTGSGCIAISLAKKLPKATVFAIDISKKALHLARENARQNGVSIHFLQADILGMEALEEIVSGAKTNFFHILVSNPPYVRDVEKREMKKNVLENEPPIALFVRDEDPLLFYIKIAELARKSLEKGGRLYFEINQYLGEEMLKMLEKKGFPQSILKKDFSGKDRFIRAIQENE